MARTPVSVGVGIAALALVLLSVFLMIRSPSAQTARAREAKIASAKDAAPVERPPVLRVDAQRATPAQARLQVDISATLEAIRSVVIGAEASGRVLSIDAAEHAPVEAGGVLVTLDQVLPKAAVARARASVVRAEAARSLAQQQYGRQRDLSGKGISSDAEYDRSESEQRGSQAAVAEARAALAEAQAQLDKTRITAPFAGVVGSIDLEPGAYVRAGDPITRVDDLREIEVEIGVDDRQVLALAVGDAVELRVDAYPGERFPGRIRALARAPDPVTRKYRVPIVVPNDGGRLLPGMLGTVRLSIGGEQRVLRVPRSATRREFELDYLFALDPSDQPEGVAIVRKRRAGLRPVPFRPDLLDVASGLEDGELIAVSGVRELRDGARVRFELLRSVEPEPDAGPGDPPARAAAAKGRVGPG